MTVTLTYDPVLSRVRITANSLADATSALVERSTDQLLWTTVRGGIGVPVSAGALAVTVDDYEFVSGVANTYRVTPIPAGLSLPGTSGNYASTPDTGVLDITGDIDLRADATVDAWVSGTPSGELDYLISKYNTSGVNQRAYALRLSTTGQLQMVWSNDGTASIARTATVMPTPDPDTGRLAVRATLDVDNGASGHTVTFYTAPTLDGPWVQLGATVVTATTTSIFSSTAALIAGAIDAGTGGLTPGFIHAAEVRSGIGGTVVANPDFESKADGTTSFADGAGRTWTVSGTAEIVGFQTANITPVLTSIWLKSVTRPFLNRPVTVVDWSPEERPSRSGGFPAVGRTYEVAVTDVAGGLVFDLDLHVAGREDAQTLDYIRASGDVLFLHTPAGCEVPGGHVCVATSSARRPRPRGSARVFTLPLTQCAAPGPDVVGATSSWQTVLNTYASWSAVLAANPTWPDLLARIAPPSEVIVP